MDESKSILHELYVYCEWKPEPEYIQNQDSLLPEKFSALWRWLKFLGPKKSLIDSVTAHKERQQKWHIALGDEGKVIAVLTDNILEIRTKRSDYATIAARTTVSRDPYAQWRKLVWSPDCTFVALAYGNGVVSFFDLTASNLFNIPIDCSRPGGLECTDNTHAVADIVFMPLRVKDTKWSWEVLVVNYDGKVRGFLVSQMDGFTLHHTITFGGGIGAVAYCDTHATLYVAGVPKGSGVDPDTAHSAGLTAWRVLNDEPYYKLSVVSDQLEGKGNDKWQFYIPFISMKNLVFIVQMCLSPDGTKLVCIHCNGDITIWRLPLLKLMQRFPLCSQPEHDLKNPLNENKPGKKDLTIFHPADVNWWSNDEIILSRFSGSVSVNELENLRNLLSRRVFVAGAGRVTRAHSRTALALECEQRVLTQRALQHANREAGEGECEDAGADSETRMSSAGRGLMPLLAAWARRAAYVLTEAESLAPPPRALRARASTYRLLAVRTTTPQALLTRKIESGNYAEALKLAETFNLDSDQVYQQQWRKNPVSTEAIQNYLSKVSKKIWAVHQCVDRLPETMPAAKELLQFGLELTNEEILKEINKDRSEEEKIQDPDDILAEHLNAYTSELLRCRHVMLFYKERLGLYESILKYEKSTYDKDEYDRLRSNSIIRSSIETAKEGRIEALTCLWPHIKTLSMKLAVLEKLPETINPMDYQHLLPTMTPVQWFETKSPIKVAPTSYVRDWCRKEIFRSIWSSNWSEETTPDAEVVCELSDTTENISKWYERRAREIERRSGLVSHALTLISLATIGGGVQGLDNLMFYLLTLDTLVYDRNMEDITLEQLEKMTVLDTSNLLMKMSTKETFLSDLKQYLIPFLKRYEVLSKREDVCVAGLVDYLESISVDDLTPIITLLQSPDEFKLDVRTHLEIAERCLLAYTATDHLETACDLIHTILKDTSDSSVSSSEVVSRAGLLARAVGGAARLAGAGLPAPPRDLMLIHSTANRQRAHTLLTNLARSLPARNPKPTPADWDRLLKDILELQSTLFGFITREQCHEIYASALLTSGDAASIRLASTVLACGAGGAGGAGGVVPPARGVPLVLSAAREYFNSASTLNDPALDLARCCLALVREETKEIREELDLIAALQILHSFNLPVLPVQVRLCGDKMTLIEDCLKSDPNAYLASHKLLKLASLIRICGDDEIAREGAVMEAVCAAALRGAGAGGAAAAGAAARRLAALRRAPALLEHAAQLPAPPQQRSQLLAAAAAICPPQDIERILKRRLTLQLEELQQQVDTHKGSTPLPERCPSTDDEFADAITTPVIEKKDLVEPKSNTKLPLFNYLIDTIQSKFTSSDDKPPPSEVPEHAVYVQEFYRSLHPQHRASPAQYAYERFAAPAHTDLHACRAALRALAAFYTTNCLDDGVCADMENEVLRAAAPSLWQYEAGACVCACVRTRASVCAPAALYAALLRAHAHTLKDNVYLTKPLLLAEMALKNPSDVREEHMAVIRECLERMSGMAEVESLRSLGLTVNGILFNADPDYRREIILRVARCGERSQVMLACSLAQKYCMDALAVWVEGAAAALRRRALQHLTRDTLPCDAHAHTRILEGIYPHISGSDHASLIHLFTILQQLDEKPLIHGLTAAEHIKLLKKAKSASPELNYTLIVQQNTPEEFTEHMLQIMKPENIGMIAKFLRTLPPVVKIPVSVNTLYTKWLTKYFFSVSPGSESSKKWMQQYRQCASYFNKLSKTDLLEFVNDTCFSEMAVERVPAGTRNLMIMQAVDYCQQEQENDLNGQSWAQTGQELTRWARFLENFHSPTVQSIIDNSNIPRDEVWPEIEMSHGGREQILLGCAALVLRRLQPAALSSLLQCLHVQLHAQDVLHYIAEHCLNTKDETERFLSAVEVYARCGIAADAVAVAAAVRAGETHALPAHRALHALHAQHVQHELQEPVHRVLQQAYPENTYAQQLTEEVLATESGQREAFHELLSVTESLQQKKTLVDVLACWTPTRDIKPISLHCEFLHTLLTGTSDQQENLVYIKLLLTRPILNTEEIKYLSESVTGESAINMVWIILLNKCSNPKDLIVKLLQDHKDVIAKQEIEDVLIKELLDNNMLVPLVPTVMYPCVVNYVIIQSNNEVESDSYNVRWATLELMEAGLHAEAGHLFLMAMGVPAPLRGFSETVNFCKSMFLFERQPML